MTVSSHVVKGTTTLTGLRSTCVYVHAQVRAHALHCKHAVLLTQLFPLVCVCLVYSSHVLEIQHTVAAFVVTQQHPCSSLAFTSQTGYLLHKNRAEQNRAEQSRTEQSRTEQNRAVA